MILRDAAATAAKSRSAPSDIGAVVTMSRSLFYLSSLIGYSMEFISPHSFFMSPVQKFGSRSQRVSHISFMNKPVYKKNM
jgi:hypothetical protein